MKEIPITGVGLSTICRLCLSSGAPAKDLFSFSSSFEDILANAIMKCAPVLIKNGDDLPNFICQNCYGRLEETYQFQMQIIQSDKTLQCYLEQLHDLDRKPKFESSIQRPLEDPLINNTTPDNAEKHACSELHDSFGINVEMSLKCEMKDEQDNSRISPDCAHDILKASSTDSKLVEDLNVNWKVEESANFNSPCKSIEVVALKTEIEDESIDDSSLILTEFNDDAVNDFSNGVSEVSCEDTKVGFGHVSGNPACINSSDVGQYFVKFEEIFENTEKTEAKSHRFKIKNTCKKRNVKSRFLETHKTARTSKKLNRCDICNKYFTRNGHLNTHRLIHTGEKPYQCDICEKSFTRSSSLTRHKLHHTGEKPYQCHICEKFFTQSAHLNTHKLTHTGEKPYQCDVCKKSFTRLYILKTHKLLHTGEKSYQCDICKKCFTHPADLKRHKLTHTDEKPM